MKSRIKVSRRIEATSDLLGRAIVSARNVVKKRRSCIPSQFPRRATLSSLFLVALIVFVTHSTATERKRVLILHSFNTAGPPLATQSSAFESGLTTGMGDEIDLEKISLDVARYADLEMQESLIDHMRQRAGKWQPDLVVPIGSPAGVFVAHHRARLFPNTPVVYCGLDRSRLPFEALEGDSTFIEKNFNLPGFVEDILQVAPATTNIAVVIGASRVEQVWAKAFQDAFSPFTNRVQFTWLKDLPLDQILDRVKELPPRSFVFFGLLLRDGAGVTHNADQALSRIRSVANAPVNGIFQHQLGLGIVGGRLYQAELQGGEAARIAIRILRGESNLSPGIIEPLEPRYDWRELRRWNLGQLPPGSVVHFRVPTIWEEHRWWLMGGLTIGLLQAALIVALLVNLAKRRRAEQSLGESESRFQTAANAAPLMIWMSGREHGCTFFNKAWLGFTGRNLDQEKGKGWTEGVHPEDLSKCNRTYAEAFECRQSFVMEYRLRRHDGQYRWISDVGRPRYDGEKNFAGYVGSCVDVTEMRAMTEALVESQNRLSSILRTAIEGIITVNEQGVVESVNTSAEKIFRHSSAEMIGEPAGRFVLASGPTRKGFDFVTFVRGRQNGQTDATQKVKGRRKDGAVFPIELAVTEISLGDRPVITVFVRDASEREQVSRAARDLSSRLIAAQEMERSRLARELHDDITQRLARLAIDAGRVEIATPEPHQHETIREVREGLVRLSQDVHSLSYKLHPSLLEDLGLVEAIRAECERFEKDESVRVAFELEPLSSAVSPDTGLCLLRVTQEALRNVARHARAESVRVSLRSVDGGLQLAVCDTGIGFDPCQDRHRHSLGLASMRERVRLLGGELEIDSMPGHGTSIILWAPLCPEFS